MERTVPEAELGLQRLAPRMWGAALLHADTYEEVEADRSATPQAVLVVLLASFASGLGNIANHGAVGILWYVGASVALWWTWAFVTYFVGTRFLPGEETEADHGELLRTIGFSSAPGVLNLLCLVEPVAGAVFAVTLVWMLAAMVVAVRQALDYASTARALAVCAIGFPVYGLGVLAAILLLGPWPL